MKVLVTGATGQLGYDIMKELKSREIPAVGLGSKDCDITDLSAVLHIVEAIQPDAVIHCAGYTAVDKAEEEPDLCYTVNVTGTQNLITACKKTDCRFMFVSSDYVFDGLGDRPWKPDDKRNPQSEYGKSKYLGELAVEKQLEKYFIVRISWVFGINGNNFVKAILKRANSGQTVSVVADQIGSPTYTPDAAKLMADMIQTEAYGTYHITNEGCCSWYEFACRILAESHIDITVHPLTAEEYGAKARRPKNSRLDKSCLTDNGFRLLPRWEDALKRFLKEYHS